MGETTRSTHARDVSLPSSRTFGSMRKVFLGTQRLISEVKAFFETTRQHLVAKDTLELRSISVVGQRLGCGSVVNSDTQEMIGTSPWKPEQVHPKVSQPFRGQPLADPRKARSRRCQA